MKGKINKFIIVLTFFLAIVLGVMFLESQTELINNFHDYLKFRETSYRLISDSYMTVAITVISLSTITFGIVIGMMQFLVNEISYQSYEKRVLKDKKIKLIYMILMSVSLVLITIYLLADISDYPIMYFVILLVSLGSIIRLVYSLFNTMSNDLNILSIMDNNHNEVILSKNKLDYYIQIIATLGSKKSKIKAKSLNRFHDYYIKKQSLKVENKIELLKSEYTTNTVIATEELSFIVGNACRRSDYLLAKSALEYVTKLIAHRIIAFGINKNQHPLYFTMIGFHERYDKYLESSLIPIYKIPDIGSTTHEITKIANAEFARVLLEGKVLKYRDGKGYNFTFKILFTMYKDSILIQTENKYIEAISDYSNAINKLINEFDVENSIDLFLDISKYNVNLTDKNFKFLEPVNYFHITSVQSNLMIKVMMHGDEYTLEAVLEDLLSIFKISIINAHSIDAPLSLQRINSGFFDSINQTSLLGKIVLMFNEHFAVRLNDRVSQKKMNIILSAFINSIRNHMNLFVASAEIDRMMILDIANLIKTITDISSKYIRYNFEEFTSIYRDSLRLFTNFVSMYKAKSKYNYQALYTEFEDIITESLDKDLRGIVIEEYIHFTKAAQKSVSTDAYSSRCFDNLIWLPIIFKDEVLLEHILSILNSELSSKKIEVLIYDIKGEIASNERHFVSALNKFDTLKVYNKEELEKIIRRLTEIIEEKEKAAISEEEAVEPEGV